MKRQYDGLSVMKVSIEKDSVITQSCTLVTELETSSLSAPPCDITAATDPDDVQQEWYFDQG